MNNLQPWQPLNPPVNWYQPPSPVYIPPMFGNQPQLSLYQPIYSPPAQVVVVQERRRGSGLEGLAVLALLFIGSRALRNWARERDQLGSLTSQSRVRDVPSTTPRYQSTNVASPARPAFTTPNAIFGDGMMLVGKDIEPGTYRCDGRVGETLSWSRLRDASGEASSVIANYRGAGARHYVTVNDGEYFRSERSGGWALVSRA